MPSLKNFMPKIEQTAIAKRPIVGYNQPYYTGRHDPVTGYRIYRRRFIIDLNWYGEPAAEYDDANALRWDSPWWDYIALGTAGATNAKLIHYTISNGTIVHSENSSWYNSDASENRAKLSVDAYYLRVRMPDDINYSNWGRYNTFIIEYVKIGDIWFFLKLIHKYTKLEIFFQGANKCRHQYFVKWAVLWPTLSTPRSTRRLVHS